MNSTLRQLPQDLFLQSQRFPELLKAHGDPGIHVPVPMGGHVRREPIYSAVGHCALRSQGWPLARPATPIKPRLVARSGVIARYWQAGLEAPVLFVDLLQPVDLATTPGHRL